MDLDKSADTSSATSTFSTVSNTSIRTTRAAASKSLDFSLAEGLPSRRRRARPFRDQILPANKMESALIAQPEGSVLPNSLSNIILRNKYDFGRDSAGLELVPPSIPLCRLAHMEKVRFLQRNGEAVEKLDSLFRTEGYCKIDTAKFYSFLQILRGKTSSFQRKRRSAGMTSGNSKTWSSKETVTDTSPSNF